MKSPFIIGERIYFRPLELEDLEGNYVAWLNDPEVNMQNSHHVFPTTKKSCEEYIISANSSNTQIPFAIMDTETDTHIGNISISAIDYINRKCSYGIILGEKDFWGKGYAKDASYLVFVHAFDTLNMLRLYSGTTAENIGAQKLMEAMGMVKEGISRNHIFLNGKYQDIHEYGILREEFYKKFNLHE